MIRGPRAPRLPLPMAREQPTIEVREYRPGDEEAILASFNRIFGDIDPNFHPRPMETWRWRYQENPAGWRIWLALSEDGTVIGQQAGMPVRMIHDGQRVHWNQVGDTFTDPGFTRALRNPGLFFRVATPYSNNYGGAPPDKDPVLYGLPTRRAHRIGARQLAYQVCRNQNKLRAPLDRVATDGGQGVEVVELEHGGSFPEEVLGLFERFSAGRKSVAVRDAAHLTWRFLRHPEIRYRTALALRDGAPVGVAVYRGTVFDGSDDGLVVEWMVEPGDEAPAAALRGWLVERAREEGRELLTVMLPETCPEWTAFQRAGFRVEPTEYYMVGRVYHGPHTMLWLYHHWFYTLGDLDIC